MREEYQEHRGGTAEELTKARDEEEVLDAVTHRIRQSQVDKRFDVEMVHQGQPGVVLGLQGV